MWCDLVCVSFSVFLIGLYVSVVIVGVGVVFRGVVWYVVLVFLVIFCLFFLLEILLMLVNFGMGSEEWGFVCVWLVCD